MRPASSTRARPTVLIALAAILLVARLATGVSEALHPPRPGGLVSWRMIDAAVAAAAAEKKPILYDFSASWCGPCQRMERELFANPEAAAFINASYIPVRVTDDDKNPAATALDKQHEVDSLPTLVVVYGEGIEPRRLQGYPGRPATMKFLKHATTPRPIPKPHDDAPADHGEGR